MSDIEWVDAPPEARPFVPQERDPLLIAFVAALRERPGQWAKFPRTYKAASARSRFTKQYPDTEWTVRKTVGGDGKPTNVLYGRAKVTS